MRFSAILALALATYTTLAAAQNNDFRPKNADEAEKLTEDFKKLTPDSPCKEGDQACINDQFAQCANGKFQLTACAKPNICVVLPLVNKPGTSITCSTEADRKARLEDARGGGGKGKEIVGDKPNPKGVEGPSDAKPEEPQEPQEPKGPEEPQEPQNDQNPEDFRPKNADEAEKLTEDFKKLTPDSPCKNGEQACVKDQFAQCVNGKFQLTACATTLKCVVLPLVNKPGTSITCSTEADRKARLEDARGGKPKRRRSFSRRSPQNAPDPRKFSKDKVEVHKPTPIPTKRSPQNDRRKSANHQVVKR